MAIINEDYVSFETAKLLKEKRFPQSTFRCHYIIDGNDHYKSFEDRCGFGDYDIIAPTLAVAMKWLREVHSIHIVTVFLGPSLKWTPTIWKIDMVIPESKHIKSTFNTWETYEEACEAAIKYCLENLI